MVWLFRAVHFEILLRKSAENLGKNFFHNPDIILPEKLKRNVIPVALRGKLTKKRIEKLLGKSINCVPGDGGLLSYLLIDKSKIEQNMT